MEGFPGCNSGVPVNHCIVLVSLFQVWMAALKQPLHEQKKTVSDAVVIVNIYLIAIALAYIVFLKIKLLI